jgi:type II secretory pathway component PulJ
VTFVPPPYPIRGIDATDRRDDARGVHLTDLLAALALLGLVLAATVGLFAEGQRAYARGAARVESQQTARVALSRMAREIRQAGGGGGTLPPIAIAEPSRIVVQHDADGDGRATTRGETVTWLLSGDVLRRNAGAGAQPIVNGVRALTFTYLDASRRETTAPAAVHTVVIVLATSPEHRRGDGPTTKLTTEVGLRNH